MARAGMSDEEMTTFLKETFCVDSARTVWDFQRTTLASGVWRTYLPTLRAVPTDAAAPTYLPPALICQVGLPTMKKHKTQRESLCVLIKGLSQRCTQAARSA